MFVPACTESGSASVFVATVYTLGGRTLFLRTCSTTLGRLRVLPSPLDCTGHIVHAGPASGSYSMHPAATSPSNNCVSVSFHRSAKSNSAPAFRASESSQYSVSGSRTGFLVAPFVPDLHFISRLALPASESRPSRSRSTSSSDSHPEPSADLEGGGAVLLLLPPACSTLTVAIVCTPTLVPEVEEGADAFYFCAAGVSVPPSSRSRRRAVSLSLLLQLTITTPRTVPDTPESPSSTSPYSLCAFPHYSSSSSTNSPASLYLHSFSFAFLFDFELESLDLFYPCSEDFEDFFDFNFAAFSSRSSKSSSLLLVYSTTFLQRSSFEDCSDSSSSSTSS